MKEYKPKTANVKLDACELTQVCWSLAELANILEKEGKKGKEETIRKLFYKLSDIRKAKGM